MEKELDEVHNHSLRIQNGLLVGKLISQKIVLIDI